MNGTIKKLYNVLVIGGTLAAAACDRPAQRPPTTPTPDAQAFSSHAVLRTSTKWAPWHIIPADNNVRFMGTPSEQGG